jgi:hypothetical protein
MNDQASRLRQSLARKGFVSPQVEETRGRRILVTAAGIGKGATTICLLLRQALRLRGVTWGTDFPADTFPGGDQNLQGWSLLDGSQSHRRTPSSSAITPPHDIEVMVMTPDTASVTAAYARVKSCSVQLPQVRLVGVINQVTDAAHAARMEERLRHLSGANLGFSFSHFDQIPWQMSLGGGMALEHLGEVQLSAEGACSIERIAAQILGWEFVSSRRTSMDDNHGDRCGISCQTLAVTANIPLTPDPESGPMGHDGEQDSMIEFGEAGWASRALANQSCDLSGDNGGN